MRCSPPLSPACFIGVQRVSHPEGAREPAFRFARRFITVLKLLSAVLSVLSGIIRPGPLVNLFADGYDAQTAELAVSLTR